MKILVVGPSWIGDMMMSQSLYRTLKARNPEISLDVMAPDWCAPLLKRMPEVNRTIRLPIGHGELALGQRYQLGKSLRSEGYQRAYILPNSFKSALIPFFAQIPQRVGWKGEIRYGLLTDLRTLDKTAFPLMVERYVALAYSAADAESAKVLPRPLLWPQFQVDQQEIQSLLTHLQLPHKPLIAFCPGAEFGPAKRWPHFHYAKLAQALMGEDYQILLLGSAKDQIIGESIIAALPETHRQYCTNLAGKTTLDQAIVLLAATRAVISNDSGLMHIAAALGKPLVALYGPSSPDFTPPLSHQARIIRLTSGYQKIRTGDAQQGYHRSLIDITPELVIDELNSLLAQGNISDATVID